MTIWLLIAAIIAAQFVVAGFLLANDEHDPR